MDTRQTLNKVAQVTLAFWIMKVLATTLGETAGDFLSMSLGLGYTVGLAITAAALGALLVAQISARRFHPALYWAAIIGTTTAGTEISDLMDRTLGLGYVWGSALLAAGLAATLAVWWARERDLSVAPITERSTELFYWTAILFSNSLGTAFGDYLTDVAGLSCVQGALVTAAVIGVVLLLHTTTKLSDVLLFWVAFVFTRPFGATFGDLLTKTPAQGGLELPRGWASLVTLALLATVLAVSTWRAGQSVEAAPEPRLS